MSLPSTFNLESFQQGSFEGVGDTRRLRLEPGEYTAVVRGPYGEATKLRVEKEYLILDISWQPSDDQLQSKLNVEKLPPVRQSLFLDLTPGGGLDMGPYKNAELNTLLKIFGMGENGAPWKFENFVGRPARIKVVHKPNEKNPADPYVNVVGVTKL